MSTATSCSVAEVQEFEDAGLSQASATLLCNKLLSNAATQSAALQDTRIGLDSGWLVLCGALVFIMHGGFAMLCAGAMRTKNTLNILLQTILDAFVSAIFFYCIGFGFAYGEGDHPNRFIGDALFGLARYSSNFTGVGIGRWTDWFFQWTFAATAATIPAGCVAERFNFNAYLGWLTYFDVSGLPSPHKQPDEFLFGSGMIDFAGSAVIHLVGGFTGMMGAWLVGPRLGRFDSLGKPVDMPGHSVVLTVLGTVLLWFGWYGFNPGSVLVISSALSGEIAGRAACCTTLSGAAAGLTCLLNAWRRGRYWDLGALCNGVLVGFVSITAGAHVVEPWAALIAGFVGALVFDGMCWVFLKLHIDDPLCAAPMHGWVGMWAVLFVGLLAKQEYIIQSYGTSNGRGDRYGAFYPGGNGHLLAAQLIGVLTISAWVCGQTGLLFFVLKKAGILRISVSEEMTGLDLSRHGGAVYNIDSKDPSAHSVDVQPSSTEKGMPEEEWQLDEAKVANPPQINVQPYKSSKVAPAV